MKTQSIGKDSTQRTRLVNTLRETGTVLACGIAYAVFVLATGIGLPCPVRLLTGFKCPGCGITTCLVSILRLDFHAAFHANPLVFCLLVPAGIYRVIRARRYVLYDTESFTIPEAVLLAVVLVITIAFGILRNVE